MNLMFMLSLLSSIQDQDKLGGSFIFVGCCPKNACYLNVIFGMVDTLNFSCSYFVRKNCIDCVESITRCGGNFKCMTNLKKIHLVHKTKKSKNNRKITITEPKLIRFFGYGYWLFGFGFGLRFVGNSVIDYFRFRFGYEPKNRMPTPTLNR